MSRLLPQSLFGQAVLILLLGLVASHLVGAWFYAGDREEAVRAIGGLGAAQRIANLTRLIEEAPAEWRERIVAASSDPGFRVSLSAGVPAIAAADEGGPAALAIERYLVELLAEDASRQLRVGVIRDGGPPFGPRFEHPMRMTGPMAHGPGAWLGLRVAVRLGDGRWLSFATAMPGTGPGVSRQFIVSMAVMAAIVLVVSMWAVRRVTAPLAELAGAAERLGRDVNAPPLTERGTVEMRQASRAFNEMQVRLKRLLENRTRMLAAISHDLRTPLTLLRLRAEGVGDTTERERMLSNIGDMDAMIEATLKFARDEAASEPRRRADVTALLGSIVDDMADAGLAVSMEAAEPVVIECQPAALRRAIANLLDNAVKYGGGARVAIAASTATVEITVDDDGPGIPEDELTRVLQPFYRVEGSRSRETGGIGLGLAIALTIVEAHGGGLILANRPEGGLRARIALPRGGTA